MAVARKDEQKTPPPAAPEAPEAPEAPAVPPVDLSAFPTYGGPPAGSGKPRPIPAAGLVAFMENTDRGAQANARAKGREWIPASPGRGWILNEREFIIRDVDGEPRLTWGDTMVMVRTEEFDRKARGDEARRVQEDRARLTSGDTTAEEQGHINTLTYKVSRDGEGPPTG